MDATGMHRADAPAVASRDPRSRAYAAARRNSTRVRLFKRVIPAGAVIAVVAVVAFAFADPFGRMTGLSLGPVSLSGTKITMENPRLTGFRNDTRPYEVTAVAATQDVRKPNVVELQEMRGRLAMDDQGTTARLEAKTGVFDTQKEQLELKDDIRVRTDNGQQVVMRQASVDFKAGIVVSREPVTVTFPDGSIDADSLRVIDGGKTITFEGRVRTVLQPSGEVKPEAQPVAQARPGAAPQASPGLQPVSVPANPAPARAAEGGGKPPSLRP